jgi:cytochrome c peroxidase
MRKLVVLVSLAIAVACLSFSKGGYRLDIPRGWPAPVYDLKKNPLSETGIALGRMLFYDPMLSRDSTISCASCHSPYNAFTHVDHDLSHGIEGKIGTRNSPALMNLAWSSSFMWDGAVNHLDMQALAPLTNGLEMDETLPNVIAKLQRSPEYRGRFKAAFGDTAITGERILKSLSQFMLTLVSASSKYDSVQRGQACFTATEQKGYELFKANCASCHTEPLFTNNRFENNGLAVDETLNDIGRMKMTKLSADSLKFKVPTLRNIQYTYPYMHDGRFKNLNQVLNNYMMGIQRYDNLGEPLRKGIYFTNTQKIALIAFLYTLSDKRFISNPEYGPPKK